MRENKGYRIWKRVLSAIVIAVMVATIANPLPAEAKVKTVKPKAAANVTTTAYAKKVAKKVTVGTTKVYLDDYIALSYSGYLKFVAPKTKTYTFTIYDLKHPVKRGDLMGSMVFMVPYGYKNSQLGTFKVSCKGGYSSRLYVANPKPTGLYYADATQVYYKSRSGGIKLKKGQVIYLGIDLHTFKFTKKRVSCTLKIK
jgi:hypothetical protein